MPVPLLTTLLLLGFQATPAVEKVALSDLAKHDKKVVTVIGKIDKYEEKTSKSSKKPYTVFVLVEGKAKVNVYMHGHPKSKFKDGDKVEVTGKYQKEKKIKDLVFKNEIDCSNDVVKTNGVKLAK